MFRGSPFSHLMIPMPGFYDYGAGAAAVAPRMVAEPKAKAAAARGAGPQASQCYSSNFTCSKMVNGLHALHVLTSCDLTMHNYA